MLPREPSKILYLSQIVLFSPKFMNNNFLPPLIVCLPRARLFLRIIAFPAMQSFSAQNFRSSFLLFKANFLPVGLSKKGT